jgi:beta-glucosidase
VASSVVRPIQELVAFEKISLNPGEVREVKFEITEPMLRFWNMENKHVSENGEFGISVGYADHPYLRESFRLV